MTWVSRCGCSVSESSSLGIAPPGGKVGTGRIGADSVSYNGCGTADQGDAMLSAPDFTRSRDQRLHELGQDISHAAYLRGRFVLRSGATSNYYFDKYLFETKPNL